MRRHWTSNADNLILGDEAVAIAELAPLVAAGGRTVVDATVPGIGRDPQALARIVRAVASTSSWAPAPMLGPTHPPGDRRAGRSGPGGVAISTSGGNGVGGTGVVPGFIGEIGIAGRCSIASGSVRAAERQATTGAGLMVHPGRDPQAPADIVRLLAEAGADLERVAIAHLDRTIQDGPGLVALGRSGVFLEFDCFGLESSYYPFDPTMATLSDAQRLDLIRGLLDAGFGERILLSQDICTKHRLVAYGGHGFAHLFAEVLPWMWRRGIDQATTTTLVVDNPARFLGVPMQETD